MIPRQPRRLVSSTGWSGPFACSCTWAARFRVVRPPFRFRHRCGRPEFARQHTCSFKFPPYRSPHDGCDREMFTFRESRQAGDEIRLHRIRLEWTLAFRCRRQCVVKCDMPMTCQSSRSGKTVHVGLTTREDMLGRLPICVLIDPEHAPAHGTRACVTVSGISRSWSHVTETGRRSLHVQPGYVRPSGPCNVATTDEQMPQTKSEASWSAESGSGTATSGQMASQVRHQIRGHTSSIDGRCIRPPLFQQDHA
jgi:hypothetical protein